MSPSDYEVKHPRLGLSVADLDCCIAWLMAMRSGYLRRADELRTTLRRHGWNDQDIEAGHYHSLVRRCDELGRLIDLLSNAKGVVAADCGGLGVADPQIGEQLKLAGA